MVNEHRRGLLLGLILCLVACAGTGTEPANQASGESRGVEEECRSYSTGNSPGIAPPRLLSGEQPAPPTGGAATGFACVRVTITSSGSVIEPVVVKTDNQEFARAFVRALSEWKYEPATRGSARVPYKTVLVARFPPE
jgi:hypothetical protein